MNIINDDNTLMEQYGIIREKRYIYRYKIYQYSNLQDALNYAKLDRGDSQVSLEEEPRNNLSKNK